MKFIAPFLFASLLTLSLSANAASPLDKTKKNHFPNSAWGYTGPSLTYIHFDTAQYLAVTPGNLWWKNIFFSSLEFMTMGTDYVPFADSWDKRHINTLYGKVAKGGIMGRWRMLTGYAALHLGFLYTDSILEANTQNTLIENELRPAVGISFGFEIGGELLSFRMDADSGGTITNMLTQVELTFSAKLHKDWEVGLHFEAAHRETFRCADDNDNYCAYRTSMKTIAGYIAYRYYKEMWIMLGFGNSSLESGRGDQMFIKSEGFTTFMSFK